MNRLLTLQLIVFLTGCADQGQLRIETLEQRVDRLEAIVGKQGGLKTPTEILSSNIVQLASDNKDGIVQIGVDLRSHTKIGAGFLFNENGIVLTNDHLLRIDLADANGDVEPYYQKTIDVMLYDGTMRRGKLVGVDPDTDLAAIKISTGSLPEPLKISGRTVKQGELAFSFGHPLGLPYSLEWRPISATYRTGRLPGTAVHQVDRGFFYGNSGGPLFDLRGEVIGMIYSTFNFKEAQKIKTKDGQKTVIYATIGWAIPAETILKIAPQLINGKYKISTEDK